LFGDDEQLAAKSSGTFKFFRQLGAPSD